MTQTARESGAETNRLPILALLAANVISVIGNMLTMVALPWFVLVTTGSAAKTGMAGFFFALPAFLIGVFGGTLVDHLGYKRVSIIADIVSGIGVLMIPLLHQTVGLAYWQLLAFVFLGALLDIPGLTARRSMLPELARMGGLRLEQVNSAFEAIQYASLLLGPPLAGLLIGWIGASNVLWIDAATFTVAATIVAVAVPSGATAERSAAGRYLDQLVAGLRFLRGDRLLFALAISLAITNFFGSAFATVVLPVFSETTYGRATELGLIAAAFGAGALAGATMYGVIGHTLPRRAIWTAGFLAFVIDPVVLLSTSNLVVIMSAVAVSAFLVGPVNPMLVTIRHERIPDELRGRVFSTFSAISAVAAPLGILLIGYAIEHLGLRSALIVITAFNLAVALGMMFVPTFREMDAARNQAAAVAR